MEGTSKVTINKFLTSARVARSMTQASVAKKLGYLTAQYVSNWERGYCLPPKAKLREISKIFAIKYDTLVRLYVDAKTRDLIDQAQPSGKTAN